MENGRILRNALIGSLFPVSRIIASGNYIPIFPSASPALFLFLFLARPAADHSAHTPTTTPFQYAYFIYGRHIEGNCDSL